MFVWAYVLPVLTDLAPFYGSLTEWLVPTLSGWATHIGSTFFDTRSVPRQFVDPILDYFDELKPTTNKIVLTGIGTGGAIAKTIGMLRHEQVFGFWGLPVFEPSYMGNFDYDEMDSLYITNVYNNDGVFTGPEPEVGNNFGVPWIDSSGVARDTRYRSLCTMFEMCATEGMLSEYCDQAVDDMYVMREAFGAESQT